MPSTFADHRRDIWYDVQLADGMPGVETVTYRKEGQAARQIVVKRVEDQADREQMELEENRREVFRLRCGRDKAHDKGGIDAPAVGDVVTREDGLQYGFTGERADVTPHAWTLVFRRSVQDVAGRIHS